MPPSARKARPGSGNDRASAGAGVDNESPRRTKPATAAIWSPNAAGAAASAAAAATAAAAFGGGGAAAPTSSAAGSSPPPTAAVTVPAVSNAAEMSDEYHKLLDVVGTPNYEIIQRLFAGDGFPPANTIPAIQVSFELFEAVQNRFAATKQVLERTKGDLLARNQQYSVLLQDMMRLKDEYAMLQKRNGEAEERNTQLHQQRAKLKVTVEQLGREVGQGRTALDALRGKLARREEELQLSQSRVAESLVALSQKEAVIGTLRRELGKLGQMRFSSARDGEGDGQGDGGGGGGGGEGGSGPTYTADVLGNIAADVEGRSQEARMKLNVADLEGRLSRLSDEKESVLAQHMQYRQHVQLALQSYEAAAMLREDTLARHVCVHTPYFTGEQEELYARLMDLQTGELLPAASGKGGAADAAAPPPLPLPSFRALTVEIKRTMDRLSKTHIDDASRLRPDLTLCVEAQRMSLQAGADLVGFLSTMEEEVLRRRLSLTEVREEWRKAHVPEFAQAVAQLMQECTSRFGRGMVGLLQQENVFVAELGVANAALQLQQRQVQNAAAAATAATNAARPTAGGRNGAGAPPKSSISTGSLAPGNGAESERGKGQRRSGDISASRTPPPPSASISAVFESTKAEKAPPTPPPAAQLPSASTAAAPSPPPAPQPSMPPPVPPTPADVSGSVSPAASDVTGSKGQAPPAKEVPSPAAAPTPTTPAAGKIEPADASSDAASPGAAANGASGASTTKTEPRAGSQGDTSLPSSSASPARADAAVSPAGSPSLPALAVTTASPHGTTTATQTPTAATAPPPPPPAFTGVVVCPYCLHDVHMTEGHADDVSQHHPQSTRPGADGEQPSSTAAAIPAGSATPTNTKASGDGSAGHVSASVEESRARSSGDGAHISPNASTASGSNLSAALVGTAPASPAPLRPVSAGSAPLVQTSTEMPSSSTLLVRHGTPHAAQAEASAMGAPSASTVELTTALSDYQARLNTTEKELVDVQAANVALQAQLAAALAAAAAAEANAKAAAAAAEAEQSELMRLPQPLQPTGPPTELEGAVGEADRAGRSGAPVPTTPSAGSPTKRLPRLYSERTAPGTKRGSAVPELDVSGALSVHGAHLHNSPTALSSPPRPSPASRQAGAASPKYAPADSPSAASARSATAAVLGSPSLRGRADGSHAAAGDSEPASRPPAELVLTQPESPPLPPQRLPAAHTADTPPLPASDADAESGSRPSSHKLAGSVSAISHPSHNSPVLPPPLAQPSARPPKRLGGGKAAAAPSRHTSTLNRRPNGHGAGASVNSIPSRGHKQSLGFVVMNSHNATSPPPASSPPDEPLQPIRVRGPATAVAAAAAAASARRGPPRAALHTVVFEPTPPSSTAAPTNTNTAATTPAPSRRGVSPSLPPLPGVTSGRGGSAAASRSTNPTSSPGAPSATLPLVGAHNSSGSASGHLRRAQSSNNFSVAGAAGTPASAESFIWSSAVPVMSHSIRRPGPGSSTLSAAVTAAIAAVGGEPQGLGLQGSAASFSAVASGTGPTATALPLSQRQQRQIAFRQVRLLLSNGAGSPLYRGRAAKLIGAGGYEGIAGHSLAPSRASTLLAGNVRKGGGGVGRRGLRPVLLRPGRGAWLQSSIYNTPLLTTTPASVPSGAAASFFDATVGGRSICSHAGTSSPSPSARGDARRSPRSSAVRARGRADASRVPPPGFLRGPFASPPLVYLASAPETRRRWSADPFSIRPYGGQVIGDVPGAVGLSTALAGSPGSRPRPRVSRTWQQQQRWLARHARVASVPSLAHKSPPPLFAGSVSASGRNARSAGGASSRVMLYPITVAQSRAGQLSHYQFSSSTNELPAAAAAELLALDFALSPISTYARPPRHVARPARLFAKRDPMQRAVKRSVYAVAAPPLLLPTADAEERERATAALGSVGVQPEANASYLKSYKEVPSLPVPVPVPVSSQHTFSSLDPSGRATPAEKEA